VRSSNCCRITGNRSSYTRRDARTHTKIHRLETVNEQLAHEIAILKRHKFAKRSEQLSPDQGSLLDDLLDTDIAAIETELKAVNPPPAPTELRQKPKRAPLPPQFPRTVIRHEPENTQCVCGCQLQRIGEDVSEKLDYTPGVFTVSSMCVENGPAVSAKH
jgi:hypothetical protein